MKKQKVASVQPEPPPAPEHLSQRTATLWKEIYPEHIRDHRGRETVFLTALECLDRCDAARRQIAAEGMTVTTPRSGVPHTHPLIRVEADARRQFQKLWGMLNLHWDRGF
jgi:phage terminase small subunit